MPRMFTSQVKPCQLRFMYAKVSVTHVRGITSCLTCLWVPPQHQPHHLQPNLQATAYCGPECLIQPVSYPAEFLTHIREARPSHQCVCSCIATERVSCMLTHGLAVPAVAVPDDLREPMHTLLSAIKQALPSLEPVLASDVATTKVKIS